MRPYKLTDSAYYKHGQTVWFLTNTETEDYQFGNEYDWMLEEHPIFLFKRSPLKYKWGSSRKIPKLDGPSFDDIVSLLTGNLTTQSMVIEDINRSENTGEFVYTDQTMEIILPEQVLFSTRTAAERERKRTLRMIKDWADKQLGSRNEMFSMRKGTNKKQQDRRSNNRSGEPHN